LIVEADRARVSLRVKLRLAPGLWRTRPFVDCKSCFNARTTVKLVQGILEGYVLGFRQDIVTPIPYGPVVYQCIVR
jgi:hypothetical protein